MKRAAIVSPIRTAVGKFQGSLASLTAAELGAEELKALVTRMFSEILACAWAKPL